MLMYIVLTGESAISKVLLYRKVYCTVSREKATKYTKSIEILKIKT